MSQHCQEGPSHLFCIRTQVCQQAEDHSPVEDLPSLVLSPRKMIQRSSGSHAWVRYTDAKTHNLCLYCFFLDGFLRLLLSDEP
jgi:hypothetical protein